MFKKFNCLAGELKKYFMSNGYKYCLGIRIKNLGEKIGRLNIFGFLILEYLSACITVKGLEIRNSVLSCHVGKVND